MIIVQKKDGESAEKLLKRFGNHVKNRKLIQKFRNLRYFKQNPTKGKVRDAAISREKYRAIAKRKQFLAA
jgi:ribosomal protein S21